MKYLTQIHRVNINYVKFDTTKNGLENFPNKDWAIIIIADHINRNYFDEIIRKSIDRNVIWISTVGKQHEFIHDMADEELLIREVERGYLPEHLIMTIGAENLEEGIFNGIFLPLYAADHLSEVVIVDVDQPSAASIDAIVEKIKIEYS